VIYWAPPTNDKAIHWVAIPPFEIHSPPVSADAAAPTPVVANWLEYPVQEVEICGYVIVDWYVGHVAVEIAAQVVDLLVL
jgi:hypothetical protein